VYSSGYPRSRCHHSRSIRKKSPVPLRWRPSAGRISRASGVSAGRLALVVVNAAVVFVFVAQAGVGVPESVRAKERVHMRHVLRAKPEPAGETQVGGDVRRQVAPVDSTEPLGRERRASKPPYEGGAVEQVGVGQLDQHGDVLLGTLEQSPAVFRIVNGEDEADLRALRRLPRGCGGAPASFSILRAPPLSRHFRCDDRRSARSYPEQTVFRRGLPAARPEGQAVAGLVPLTRKSSLVRPSSFAHQGSRTRRFIRQFRPADSSSSTITEPSRGADQRSRIIVIQKALLTKSRWSTNAASVNASGAQAIDHVRVQNRPHAVVVSP